MPDGRLSARSIVNETSECPNLLVDGMVYSMNSRAEPSETFPVRVCQYSIPDGTENVTVIWEGGESQTVGGNLKKKTMEKILIMADTGCRMKNSSSPIYQVY